MKKILLASSILALLGGNAFANDECIANAVAASEAAGNPMDEAQAGEFCTCFEGEIEGNDALQAEAEAYDPANPTDGISAVIESCSAA